MARKSDRHFSERDGLDAQDMGAYIPEADERLPAWAQQREEEDFPPLKPDAETADQKPDGADSFSEPETPAEEEAEAPAPEEDSGSDSSAPESDARKEADEAWNREATRVEGGQYRRNAPTEDRDEKPAKGKKGEKKKSKKKSRKKKNASKAEEKRSFVKLMAIILICGAVFLMVAMMVMSSFIPNVAILTVPRRVITGLIAPVQSAFADVTDSVVAYLRTLKIRGNIEYEYEQLLIKLDDMANDTARMQELIHENEQLKQMLNEWNADESHTAMNPLFAQVIGTVGNNYFSTLTLNVGAADGVSDYMAVVDNGGLVGVTYNTRENSCSVRCIIDSDCTVAGLVQSSRDQGSVKGTLGTNGEPMCRMYYLPDDHLPRPGDVVVTSGVSMSFPKGIPIGTVRESTRGMDANKQYIIVEPTADFQHIEYVNVMRYKPAAGAIQNNISSTKIELVPLETARPYPTIRIGSLNYFATDVPEGYTETEETPAPSPSAAPSVSPSPSPSPTPADLPVPPEDDFGYVVVTTHDPNITPSPSPSPTPTPYITLGPDNMTLEDD